MMLEDADASPGGRMAIISGRFAANNSGSTPVAHRARTASPASLTDMREVYKIRASQHAE